MLIWCGCLQRFILQESVLKWTYLGKGLMRSIITRALGWYRHMNTIPLRLCGDITSRKSLFVYLRYWNPRGIPFTFFSSWLLRANFCWIVQFSTSYRHSFTMFYSIRTGVHPGQSLIVFSDQLMNFEVVLECLIRSLTDCWHSWGNHHYNDFVASFSLLSFIVILIVLKNEQTFYSLFDQKYGFSMRKVN